MATPADKWRRMVAAHKGRCRDIVEVSASIRYAGVINSYGRTLAGATRPSAKPLLGPLDIKNEFFVVSTLMAQRKQSAARLGALDHAVLVHGKVYIVLVRSGDVTYYVSVGRREKDLAGLIDAVKRVVTRRA